ncbi:putative ankyrin repeat protein RF_0381 [Aspergillus udagawae]|uniref:Ankyrin repeat protein RF_0381 n=1 Tax=Aspergillus udagawae TaxID=91492 RepID=A0ABQ1B535_9EURO|nr:putative ankyrin repeat protein RF_0381 [Aspergillus udagawae]GFF93884.1 putative ankyrin repeat protein RF_0381 [Aspergillus udagawae]GFG19652.1 putative ankyrin repeat protein RF_0381 [Aspergillus udagawae]
MSLASIAERIAEILLVALFVISLWFFWAVHLIFNGLWYALHPTEIVKKILKKGGRPPVALSRSRRSLTLPLRPQEEDVQRRSHDQLQSLFFTKLAPEIRYIIYREVLVPSNALHVRRTHRRLCSMPCRSLNPRADMQNDIHSSCQPPWADDGTVARRLPGETPQQDQILSLLCSCRRVYTEAIGLLYEANSFHFDSPLTVEALPLCMVPRRLASIRYIRLDIHAFENRAIVANVFSSWEQACAVLAGLEALEELVVTLRSLDNGTQYKPLPLSPLLRPLTKIRASRFVVEVPPHDDPEGIVGGLGIVPFSLETKDSLHRVIHQCSWWGTESTRWLPPM